MVHDVKNWKTWQIGLFVLLCILLNYGGRMFAMQHQLPVWFDSFGTVLCAYVGGVVCGIIVGITGNMIYAMMNGVSYAYALISICIAVVVGISARKDRLSTFFGTMSVSTLITALSVLLSLPVDIRQGWTTGNIWGDGVAGFLEEIGFPKLPALAIGEGYIEFMDKVITLVLLFLCLRLVRMFFAKKQASRYRRLQDPSNRAGLFLLLLLPAALFSLRDVRAEEPVVEVIDYNDYVQTVYSSNNGLPCGEANDIAQTSDGILWIGTYAGLYRYNGTEFRWMDNYESVRNVNCLYVDNERRLWIGTNDNGLSISINEKIVNIVDQSDGLPSNSVRCITESSDGYYYIGTTSSMQVLMLNSGLKRVTTLREVNYADVIAADGNGHVAAITNNGRLFLLKEGKVLSSLQLTGEEELFNSCGFDRDGRLLVGSSTDHIYVYDVSSDYFVYLEEYTCEGLSNLNDLYFLEDGKVFVSSDNGLGYLDENHYFHNINVNDFSNSIDNMLVDYQGNLWFTSSRLGLLRMSQSSFKDVYTTTGIQSHVVNAVSRWQDSYYFGTDKGLDVVDSACRSRIVNELTEKLADVRIRCIYADSNGHLWICTYGQGLLEVTPDGEQYLYNSENGSFGSRARLVTELSDGTIVAGGDTGISFIRDHRIIQTIDHSHGLSNAMILSITEMEDGRILAGTDGDGIAVIRDEKIIDVLGREDGLSSGVILRTVKDPKADALFIVTSNGLCYLDEGGSIRSLDNFPYFNNYDIWMKDNETLFVMSSAGIYVVDRSELLSGSDNIAYDLLDSRKGLNSALTANSWNYDDGHGNLFLSCDKGVFIIDTDRYSTDTRSYRMNISSVLMDGVSHRVEQSRPVTVPRGISRIELNPEVINYTIQNPYVGYYLEGFESQWTILPQSSLGTIVYTNLPMGEYTFHLAVFDSSKENVLEERLYPLIKDKEIYDNRWFKIYMLIVGMIFVAWLTTFLFRTHMNRLMRKQAQELALVRRQVQMGNETIMTIANAVDAKDVRTSEHSKRVSEYSYLIGQELGFSEVECENLRKAARMHDIGKIGIPDVILNKTGRLTDEEYAKMKTHVSAGGEILKDVTQIDHVVEGALYHHERYDGKGYPKGLKGEEIPLYGRIIGVADAFDAMTANRVYRNQLDFDYVLNEMRKGRGTQFDPQFVDILLRLIEEGKIDIKALYPARQDAGTSDRSEGGTA